MKFWGNAFLALVMTFGAGFYLIHGIIDGDIQETFLSMALATGSCYWSDQAKLHMGGSR